MLPTRPVAWNVDHLWLFYLLATTAVAAFVWGVARRVRLWRAADPRRSLRLDPRRLGLMIRDGLLGAGMLRGDPLGGAIHWLIAWGFFGLFVGTVLMSLHEYLLHFLVGRTYLVYSVAMELCGLALVAGLCGAALRRTLLPAARLRAPGPLIDALPLAWLAAIALTGFLLEGARLAAQSPGWGEWSFVGAALAVLSPSESSGLALYRALWWTHALLSLGLIGWIPHGKLLHTVAAPLALMADRPAPRPLADDEDAPPPIPLAGAHRLSLDACTRCGRCVEVCPSALAGEPLAPRAIVAGLRQALADLSTDGAAERFARTSPKDPPGLWHCTTCRACQTVCPVAVAPIDLVAEMRAAVVEAGQDVPPKLGEVLERLYKYKNPWISKKGQKAAWAKGRDLPDLSKKKTEPTEWTWFVGCTTTLDTRAQGIARALAGIFEHAGLSAGTLGKKEPCCGDVARRAGEAGLFDELRDEMSTLLRKRGLSRLVVTSPHCFDTLREAPDLEVVHATTLVARLVAEQRLRFAPSAAPRRVTYHDPCFLARHHGLVDEPRRVLRAIPGLQLVEMERHGRDALCCGGGGGRMWQELEEAGDLARRRIEHAAETGATTLVTACPLCLIMLEDARKTAEFEERLEVIDLCELTFAALADDGDDAEKRGSSA